MDSPLLLFLSNVVCVVRVMGGPLYSLERLVPTISLYENIANRLLEDQINLPAKMHLDGKQGWFGQTSGSAGPTSPLLATVLLWCTAWWVLMSDGRCRGLVGRFALVCGPPFSCYAGYDRPCLLSAYLSCFRIIPDLCS